MTDASVYEDHAKRCAEQAQLVTRADDRARWLQLANEWTVLSRLKLRKLPTPPQRSDPSYLWRGDGTSTRSTKR
jgi:hypothetical protein